MRDAMLNALPFTDARLFNPTLNALPFTDARSINPTLNALPCCATDDRTITPLVDLPTDLLLHDPPVHRSPAIPSPGLHKISNNPGNGIPGLRP